MKPLAIAREVVKKRVETYGGVPVEQMQVYLERYYGLSGQAGMDVIDLGLVQQPMPLYLLRGDELVPLVLEEAQR